MEKKSLYKLVLQNGQTDSFLATSYDKAVSIAESIIRLYKRMDVTVKSVYLWSVVSTKPNRYSLVKKFDF